MIWPRVISPGLTAYRGEGTDAAAVQLVAPPGAHDLKVERLVKLAELLRREAQFDGHFAVSRDHPSEDTDPVASNSQSDCVARRATANQIVWHGGQQPIRLCGTASNSQSDSVT